MKKNTSENTLYCKEKDLLYRLTYTALEKNKQRGYQYAVLGEGYISQNLIIGEAMGAKEERDLRIFVGRSGMLLRSYLEKIGVKNFFIMNTVCFRPPNNREPDENEITEYTMFIKSVISIMNVKNIMCLGRVSRKVIESIQHELHNIALIYNYHPAYLLYSRNPKSINMFIEKIIQFKSLFETVDNIDQPYEVYKISEI